MNFNYRHKTVTLNTLNSSKISAIVNNIAKQKEDKLKKYLNDQQINNYLTELPGVTYNRIADLDKVV